MRWPREDVGHQDQRLPVLVNQPLLSRDQPGERPASSPEHGNVAPARQPGLGEDAGPHRSAVGNNLATFS